MALSDRIPYQAIVDRPPLRLPGGARVAVWVIVNVEVWRIDLPQPRSVLPPPMGRPLVPDVPNWSWHEYGMRVGFWRQLEALAARGLPASLAIGGRVCDSYPRVAEAAAAAGWEFMGHGLVQGPMHDVADQDADIAATVEAIERRCGTAPVSWESPGLTETEDTLDTLARHGIRYVADWVIDDLPERIETPSGPVFTLPYTVETNDITVFALQGHPAEEFTRRGRAQFDRLHAEGAHTPRVMAISVHPYITGVPHRIGALEALLDHIAAADGVCWMTARQVGQWYEDELARLAAP